ncbi:hypothetical protein M3Y94_00842400 [Aphelenchoides besseyi]|nr:hypothetical protein M3Y94_00842400 [Aphelenchoides besseyi]
MFRATLLNKTAIGILVARLQHTASATQPIQRQRLAQGWRNKNLASSLYVDVASAADRDIVLRYMEEETRIHEPVISSTNAQASEVSHLFEGILDRSIDSGLSLLMFNDEHELVGIRMTSTATMPEKIPSKHFEILPDYKHIIDKEIAKSRKDKQIGALCTVMYEAGVAHIPLKPNETYFCMELIGIKPEYRGDGLAKRFCQELFKLAAGRGINFGEVLCTADATKRICSNFGFKVALEMPYTQFKDGGEVCFKETIDGSKSAQLLIGDLREIGFVVNS